jgi:23S rRNA-/tRNA-specific pseudouridylate synthase
VLSKIFVNNTTTSQTDVTNVHLTEKGNYVTLVLFLVVHRMGGIELGSVAKMAENKMEAVAQLFGKKLNEEFKIIYKDENYIAYFRNEGLRVRGLFCLTWDNALVALLTGRAVIVND